MGSSLCTHSKVVETQPVAVQTEHHEATESTTKSNAQPPLLKNGSQVNNSRSTSSLVKEQPKEPQTIKKDDPAQLQHNQQQPQNDETEVVVTTTEHVRDENTTILGHYRKSHLEEPKITYFADFDLLADSRCLVPWKEEYATGLDLVDNQHKMLVCLINDLNQSLKLGYEGFVVGSVLDSLIEYTDFHFRREEDLMEQYRYKPHSMAKHKETHRGFVKTIFELREDYRLLRKDNIGPEVLEFLKDWLLHHILLSDKKMCAFFLSQMEREKNGLPLE